MWPRPVQHDVPPDSTTRPLRGSLKRINMYRNANHPSLEGMLSTFPPKKVPLETQSFSSNCPLGVSSRSQPMIWSVKNDVSQIHWDILQISYASEYVQLSHSKDSCSYLNFILCVCLQALVGSRRPGFRRPVVLGLSLRALEECRPLASNAGASYSLVVHLENIAPLRKSWESMMR